MHVVHWIVPLFSLTSSCSELLYAFRCLVHISLCTLYEVIPSALAASPLRSSFHFVLFFFLLSDSEIYRLPYTFSSYNKTDSFQLLIMYILDVTLLSGVLPHRFVVLCSCPSDSTAETKFTSSVVRTSFT